MDPTNPWSKPLNGPKRVQQLAVIPEMVVKGGIFDITGRRLPGKPLSFGYEKRVSSINPCIDYVDLFVSKIFVCHFPSDIERIVHFSRFVFRAMFIAAFGRP
jgi:hypothetical protein